jgi:hypothetical protein
MNRIRHKDGQYQVLLTPHLTLLPSMELLVGNWDDEHLRGFSVQEYNTLPEAQLLAFRLPDLDWYKLVRMHINHYHDLLKIINHVIDKYHFIVNLIPKVTSPEELKTITFDRVLNLGHRYAATYNMNDIISFNIINPWTKNIDELSKVLISIPELRIKKRKVYNHKIIHLIGLTELGSTYEIKLWTTVVFQTVKWLSEHSKENSNKTKLDEMFKEALKLQSTIDKDLIIR